MVWCALRASIYTPFTIFTLILPCETSIITTTSGAATNTMGNQNLSSRDSHHSPDYRTLSFSFAVSKCVALHHLLNGDFLPCNSGLKHWHSSSP